MRTIVAATIIGAAIIIGSLIIAAPKPVTPELPYCTAGQVFNCQHPTPVQVVP